MVQQANATLALLLRPPIDESEVIAGLLVGDPEAAAAFVREYEPRIRRAVWEARVPPSDVPDVTQEILIDAIRQLSRGQFAQRSALRTWLRRVTEGRIADYWRSAGRRGMGKLVSIETTDAGTASFLTEATQEARVLAQEALDAMPTRHRFALVACCRGNLPVEELARLLGVSTKRAYGIVAEAKAMFRKTVCGREKPETSQRLPRQGA